VADRRRKLERPGMIFTASASEIDFVPDGDLGKKVWAAPSRVRFACDAFRGTEYPTSETTVACLWTSEYLYLAYWCRYESLFYFPPEELCSEGNELWTRDVVEAFVAPENLNSKHYFEFEVSPNNRGLDLEISVEGGGVHSAAWESGFEHASRIDRAVQMWTVEMRIPARTMGVRIIGPEVDWRINLYRADGSYEQRRLLSWAPLEAAKNTFHQPEAFGILRFAARRR